MQRCFSEELKRAAAAPAQNGESQLSVARHLGISNKTLSLRCVTARRVIPAEELSAMDTIAQLRKLELGRGRGISNLDKKARITRPAPLI